MARWTRFVAIACIVAIGVNSIWWAYADWHLSDMHVYQEAALRVRAGEQLYGGDVDPLSAYRHAPWFAYAWVPLTYLPQMVINVAWSAFLLAGSALSIWMVVRPPSPSRILLVMLMGPILFGISAIGNVQGPMVALLLAGMPRRWAGLAVGVAASLKVVPLVLALVFMAERRWWQLLAALSTTAVLWLPLLWLDAQPVTFDPGMARTLPAPAWLLIAAMGMATAALLAWQQSIHTPLAAAAAALLSLPRLFVYEISLLLVGTAGREAPARRSDPMVPDAERCVIRTDDSRTRMNEGLGGSRRRRAARQS